MNRIVSFFRGKGFYIALAVCILAAAGSSFWAIRNVTENLNKGQKPPVKQEVPQPWQQPEINVEQKIDNVPKPSQRPSQPESSSSGCAKVQQPDTALPDSAALAEPSFTQPAAGRIINPFSGEELVYNKTMKDWRTHNGVDISCKENETIKSAVAGKVCNVFQDDMWGQVVDIQAGELVWRYTGLDSGTLKVKLNDSVAAGQPLGKLGTATAEVGEEPHLHLEVLKNGTYVNPEEYFQ